ncbi:MAG: HD domain-containing protein [Deltaproteobacteria bacterium]|nr:HD domain-containing protein [Deltaproteobacteria bacterium]
MTSNHSRILAVDDEKTILRLYEKILSREEAPTDAACNPPVFDLTFCSQAEEAVEAVQKGLEEGFPFAVVFLDIYMPPGPDGIQAAEQIRELDSNVGIALVTGQISADLKEIARRIPPPDKLLFLQKPFSPVEIWQLAFSLCAKWRSEKQLRAMQSDLESLVEKRTYALTEVNIKLKEEVENRMRAEKTARSSEENYRNMIVSNADGIVIFDEDRIVRFVNPAAEAIFGVSADGLACNPFAYPVIAGEATELDIVRDDMPSMVVEMRVARTKWKREPAYLATFRDITEHSRIKEDLRKSMNGLQETMRGTIRAMAITVESRDPYTAGHQQRVAELSRYIAQQLDRPPDWVEGLYLAALIHDIGKISVPAEILSKPGRLSDLEFSLIKAHSESGYNILKPIDFSWPIAEIVFQHHERWNGSGYPRGLAGNDLLLEARILGVADVVEAMASHRPYRPSVGIDAALEEISGNRGILYDPDVVDACLILFKEKAFTFAH